MQALKYLNETAEVSAVRQPDVQGAINDLTNAIAALEEHTGTLEKRLEIVSLPYKTAQGPDGMKNAPAPARSQIGGDIHTLAGRVYALRHRTLDMIEALQV